MIGYIRIFIYKFVAFKQYLKINKIYLVCCLFIYILPEKIYEYNNDHQDDNQN